MQFISSPIKVISSKTSNLLYLYRCYSLKNPLAKKLFFKIIKFFLSYINCATSEHDRFIPIYRKHRFVNGIFCELIQFLIRTQKVATADYWMQHFPYCVQYKSSLYYNVSDILWMGVIRVIYDRNRSKKLISVKLLQRLQQIRARSEKVINKFVYL